MKCFADVNISQPRYDPLIEKRRFDRCVFPPQRAGEVFFVEGIPQRFRSKMLKHPMLIDQSAIRQIHRTETSRIIEGNAGAIRHVKNHIVGA